MQRLVTTTLLCYYYSVPDGDDMCEWEDVEMAKYERGRGREGHANAYARMHAHTYARTYGHTHTDKREIRGTSLTTTHPPERETEQHQPYYIGFRAACYYLGRPLAPSLMQSDQPRCNILVQVIIPFGPIHTSWFLFASWRKISDEQNEWDCLVVRGTNTSCL